MKANRVIPVLILLITILPACAQTKMERWQEQYDLGIRYLTEGKYEEAVLAFTVAIDIYPKLAPSYEGRGDAYVEIAKLSADASAYYESAISDYTSATEIDAEQATVFLKLGTVYDATADNMRAVDAYSRALTLNSTLTDAYALRGDAYVRLATSADSESQEQVWYQNAIGDYRIVAQENGSAELFLKLGSVYGFTKDYESAVEAYSAALEYDDTLGVAYVGRGDALVALAEGLLEEENHSKRTSESVETDVPADKQDEMPEEIEELYEKAKADYLSALELDEQHATLYGKVADIYLTLDDFDNVVDILDRGIEAASDESLKKRLKELLHNRSRTITVDAEIIDCFKEYYDEFHVYIRQYYPPYHVGIRADGIRFSPPVNLELNGEIVSISQANISVGSNQPITEMFGIHTVTGYFYYTGEERLYEIGADHIHFNPNGPYVFKVTEMDGHVI